MLARIHAKLGDADRAFASLETAYRERSGYIAYLNVDPKMDELRGDPRFHDLVRRLRLPGIEP